MIHCGAEVLLHAFLKLSIKHCICSYSNPSSFNVGRIDCLSCRADLKVMVEIKFGFQTKVYVKNAKF